MSHFDPRATFMAAFFNDRAFFHDHDSVCGFDGGQAMRDQDAGCVFQNEIQRLLDLPFSEWVNAGGGFIQNEDGGVLHEHAHQRHELTLPHGEALPRSPTSVCKTIGQGFQPFAVTDLLASLSISASGTPGAA
jgi:hypothetical protein